MVAGWPYSAGGGFSRSLLQEGMLGDPLVPGSRGCLEGAGFHSVPLNGETYGGESLLGCGVHFGLSG